MNVALRNAFVLAALAIPVALSSAQSAPAASEAASGPPEQAPGPGSTVGVSQVRIVRLSQVKGDVRLDRRTDQKFELAFVNLPIIAGERLQTLDGVAEVEFEDNSSLRITPNSLIEFPVLGRDPSGTTRSTVKLISGTLYVSMAGSKGGDALTVSVGNKTITPPPSSHLRLDLAASSAKLAVFQGSVTVADASGTTVVNKKKALSFDTASAAPPVFAHNQEPEAFDRWDKTAVDYHQVRSSASAFTGSPYAYGVSDLSYYGSFSNLGGCGSMWRPYLASAAWDPYGSGVWSWYPGTGYSWVSAYPWGWTPYHSGNWEYCPGSSSWGWRPGGAWNGLINHPTSTPVHGGRRRPLAPEPPRAGQSTLVAVNVKPIPMSRVESGNGFVFRADSAGLGVPRGVFNLGKISQNVAQHGVATASVSDSQAQRGLIAISRPASSVSSRAGGTSGSAGASSMSTASAAHASSPSFSSGGHASSSVSSGGGSHH